MSFKFEKLEVWQLALDYLDLCYGLADKLPKSEEYNLQRQLRRAATSIALNIAEGSTGQSDPEKARFLGLALRSLVETIACLHIIKRRRYVAESTLPRQVSVEGNHLARQLQSMRRTLSPVTKSFHETEEDYAVSDVGLFIEGPFNEDPDR